MPLSLRNTVYKQQSHEAAVEDAATTLADNASTIAGDGMDMMVDTMLYGDLDMDVALSEAIPGLKDRQQAHRLNQSPKPKVDRLT